MTTELLGREVDVVRLGVFLETVDALPAALLLEGEPGIGKTTLWRAGLELGRERGFIVLKATPATAETRLSFSALADLLEPVLPDALDALPRPQRHAIEVALLLEESSGPPPEPRAVNAALLGLLRSLATEPVLVAVDDIQWLDAPSAAALAFALRRLETEPVAVLLTRRFPSVGAPPVELVRSVRAISRIQLGPLSLGATQRLVVSRLDRRFPRPVLRQLHEASGGNPFYALEIAQALQRRGAGLEPGEALPIPDDLDELVRERLVSLPARTLRALLVASLAADPTVALLEASLGPAAGAALKPALDAHVVELLREQVCFTHPLVAASVLAHANPLEKRLWHDRLAGLVESSEERARHLALGADKPDVGVAATLDDAARHAAGRGAPAAAAVLSELAIRLTPPGQASERVRRKLEAAAHLYGAGDIPRTRALVEPLLRGLPPGPDRARAALQLAWTTGDMVIGERLLQQALEEGKGEPALLLGAHYYGVYVALVHRGVRSARDHARAAVELAEAGSDEGILGQCLAALILTRTLAGETVPEQLAERAVSLEARRPNMPTYYPPTLVCGQRAMFLGRFEEARQLLDAAHRRIVERGDETMIGGVRWHQVDLECRAGNWELAADYSAEGLAAVEPLDYAREAVLLYAQALIDAHLGRVEEARAAAERGLDLSRANRSEIFAILNAWVLGFLDLSLGNHTAAVQRLRPLPDLLAADGWGEPGICGALPDLIEALTALGRVDEASSYVGRLEQQARMTGSKWARALASRSRALVMAAERDYAIAAEAFDCALREHTHLPEPFQRARTLLAYGAMLRRMKRRRRARELLEAAQAIFEELGAAIWAERTRAELTRIGGRAPSAGRLTPIEERVAALVAEGRTNREVGAALNLSSRTVEGHLSRVYAKLCVRSRVELAYRGGAPKRS